MFAHKTAHEVGLRSNVTIMFGAIEQPAHWAKHLIITRDLQKVTGGFTEFVPLPFVHIASRIYLQRKARRGPTFRETLLMRQLLQAGCNDLGGTLMNENISRAAGATHGQGLEPEDFAAIVASLGRSLAQRTTLYGRAEESPLAVIH